MTNFWNLQEEKWLTIGVIYGCNTGTNKERKHGNPGKIINVFHFPGEKRHPDELENYLKLDCLAFDELRKTICRKRPFSMRLIAFTINDDKILIVFLIKNSSKNKPSFIRTKSNRTFEIVWGHDTAVSIIGLWGARYCSIDYWLERYRYIVVRHVCRCGNIKEGGHDNALAPINTASKILLYYSMHIFTYSAVVTDTKNLLRLAFILTLWLNPHHLRSYDISNTKYYY